MKNLILSIFAWIILTLLIIIPLVLIFMGMSNMYYRNKSYKKGIVPFESKLLNKTNYHLGIGDRFIIYDIKLDSISPKQLESFPLKANRITKKDKDNCVLEWTKFDNLPLNIQKILKSNLKQKKKEFPVYYADLVNSDLVNDIYFSGTFECDKFHSLPMTIDDFLKLQILYFKIDYYINIKTKKLFIEFWEPGMFP